MKKADVIVLAVLISIGFLILNPINVKLKAEPTDTYQQGWQLVRETAVEDAADFATAYDLDGDDGVFAAKDSATVLLGGAFRIKSQRSDLGLRHSFGDHWQFIICGTSVGETDTFGFSIVGWAAENGPLQVIADGDGILGSQDVVLYPDDSAAATDAYWADDVNLNETTKWTKAEGGANGVSVFNDGDNEIAVIQLYPQGLEWIQFVIYGADGGNTAGECDTVTVYGRRI